LRAKETETVHRAKTRQKQQAARPVVLLAFWSVLGIRCEASGGAAGTVGSRRVRRRSSNVDCPPL